VLFLSLLYWAFLASFVVHILSSLLYAIVFYLAIRYGLDRGLMTGADFAVGTVVGVGSVGPSSPSRRHFCFLGSLAAAIGDRARVAASGSL
jgi:hypothetical protein